MTFSCHPSEFHRIKLTPERIDEMRRMIEGSTLPFRRIAEALDVSAATVSRYARLEGWQRPAPSAAPALPDTPDPAPAADGPGPDTPRPDAPHPANRREHIVDRLWTLAERHAKVLETQPIERAERSLQPLARLTRTLGEMDKHRHLANAPGDDYPDLKKPKGRTLHELRDELAAHLERINREEGYGWEVQEWWFNDGGGI